ncbi:TlpA disulfide reductase family protein [Nocardioides caldifontis]|uniref:TlpA disulfide reductase family protein n=1 Tax=Nocardioides caldifontis TaxID=2588938 RepID=UPI0011E05C55|nr:TlpA disulfide reductase family protein [Nocardioides caldifontis]
MRLAALLCAAVVLLTGCSGGPSITAPDPSTDVAVDTPELRSIREKAGIEECPRLGDGPGTPALPDVTLPCLGGGPDVQLQRLEGPAVVAVWAQWCMPCRKELPWYQRLHEGAGDRLTVLGLDWQDLQPKGALELAAALGVTFPSVADVDAELDDGARGLPLVYFVSGDGVVTTKRGQLDGYDDLADLVAQHTGVMVRAG